MLESFKFKNFKSYKDECSFSMLATSDNAHENNLVSIKKDRLSKVSVIYGANASGKTSFIDALDFIRAFALKSNELVEGNRIYVTPYKFCEKPYENPSHFTIKCYVGNIKYVYSFSCTYKKVVTEKLDVYYSSKSTNIFTRVNTNEYKFLTADEKSLTEIMSKNTENKLFLITAATWNYEKVKPLVKYIMQNFIIIHDASEAMGYNLSYIKSHGELDEFKKFCIEFLNNADLNIKDFRINTAKISDYKYNPEAMNRIENMLRNDMLNNSVDIDNLNLFNVKTYHEVIDDGNKNVYELDMREESNGTNALFELMPFLYFTIKEGKTLIVDEIDKSLHPLIVEYIIKKFQDKDFNKNNAQLICNTHDTNLLDLNIFRRDEIWFTDKNYKNGGTEIYSLAEYSPRTNENIEKAYLLGRFGGIPFIKGV